MVCFFISKQRISNSVEKYIIIRLYYTPKTCFITNIQVYIIQDTEKYLSLLIHELQPFIDLLKVKSAFAVPDGYGYAVFKGVVFRHV